MDKEKDQEEFEEIKNELNKLGPLTSFAIASVLGAIKKISQLNEEKGKVVVATRTNERKYDPETFKVDEVAEGYFLERIKQSKIPSIIISEELGKKLINAKNEDDIKYYFISDPFDGSWLYKRGLKKDWYTTLAIYTKEGIAVTSAVGDIINKIIYFCNSSESFTLNLDNNKIKKIKPSNITLLKEATISSYLLKPHRMYPTIQQYENIFKNSKFINTNGGPNGFCEVANASTDAYLAINEPFIEIFSALPIAIRAKTIVTDFQGNQINFDLDYKKKYNILCSSTKKLHEEILSLINQKVYK